MTRKLLTKAEVVDAHDPLLAGPRLLAVAPLVRAAEGHRVSRFQFCWYGWRSKWLRFFVQRDMGNLRTIYDWRLAIGPLDIRQWGKKWRSEPPAGA